MTILNFEFHPNVDMATGLTKIKDFAAAQGWNVVHFSLDTNWGATGSSPPYGFVAGSSGNLILENNLANDPSFPHPNQTLHFRIRFANIRSSNQHEPAKIMTTTPANYPVDYNSSTDPMADSLNIKASTRYTYQSLNPTGNMNLWLYGNNHQIIANFQMSATINCAFWVGTVELFDTQDLNGGLICDHGGVDNWSSYWYWNRVGNTYSYHYGLAQIHDQSNGRMLLYKNALVTTAKANVAYSYDSTSRARICAEPRMAGRLVKYSNKRALVRGLVWVYEPDHTSPVDRYQQHFPYGTIPIWHCNVLNLPIGAEIKFGGQIFHCFPRFMIRNERPVGYAIRVA